MIRLENITKIYNEKVDDTKALDDVKQQDERQREFAQSWERQEAEKYAT